MAKSAVIIDIILSMSERKEGDSVEFQLRVVCVKMKMKFPCRMAL